jgi:hypothetical protein
MHYDKRAFSMNGMDTIKPLVRNKTIILFRTYNTTAETNGHNNIRNTDDSGV